MTTPLLDAFNAVIATLRGAFSQERTFFRAGRLLQAQVLALGLRTVTRLIAASGREDQDWSADYRLFSRCLWTPRQLFCPIIREVIAFFDQQPFITIAGDFTHLAKTGKKIPHVQCMRDPMSPPFHVNLIYGLRFVQYTAVLPLYNSVGQVPNTPPRSIPLLFDELPMLNKPKHNATEEEIGEYKRQIKQHLSTNMALQRLIQLREDIDNAGAKNKTIMVALDGSFCNQTFFAVALDRINLLVRCRKDARLCFAAPIGDSRFYSKDTFTPEEVRQNQAIDYVTGSFFHGGSWRELRYKEVNEVYWQKGAKRRPLRLIVVAPTPYRKTKKGRLLYRQEGYILTTDLTSPAFKLVQAYLDRWQIEVNHREEKSTFGLGDAQVRNEKSVPRQPAFTVAAYSILLLSAQHAYGGARGENYMPMPKWRKGAKRPSCLDIVTQLRRECDSAPHKLIDFNNVDEPLNHAGLRAAA